MTKPPTLPQNYEQLLENELKTKEIQTIEDINSIVSRFQKIKDSYEDFESQNFIQTEQEKFLTEKVLKTKSSLLAKYLIQQDFVTNEDLQNQLVDLIIEQRNTLYAIQILKKVQDNIRRNLLNLLQTFGTPKQHEVISQYQKGEISKEALFSHLEAQSWGTI